MSSLKSLKLSHRLHTVTPLPPYHSKLVWFSFTQRVRIARHCEYIGCSCARRAPPCFVTPASCFSFPRHPQLPLRRALESFSHSAPQSQRHLKTDLRFLSERSPSTKTKRPTRSPARAFERSAFTIFDPIRNPFSRVVWPCPALFANSPGNPRRTTGVLPSEPAPRRTGILPSRQLPASLPPMRGALFRKSLQSTVMRLRRPFFILELVINYCYLVTSRYPYFLSGSQITYIHIRIFKNS